MQQQYWTCWNDIHDFLNDRSTIKINVHSCYLIFFYLLDKYLVDYTEWQHSPKPLNSALMKVEFYIHVENLQMFTGKLYPPINMEKKFLKLTPEVSVLPGPAAI